MVSDKTLSAVAAIAWVLGAPVAAQAQANFAFDLPAQPLERALRAVATRTGTNIVFSGATVQGKQAPRLSGTFTPAAAYRALLQGSGLSLGVTSGGSFVVTGPQTGDRAPGTITGHIVEADGNRNVAGALVRIVETGQTTTADDLGGFRFPGIAPGTYTIEISFLGFPTITQSVTVDGTAQPPLEFAMGEGGTRAAEIVVYGSRSARANALNLQRTAENSADVISADDLGNFTGTTFSDALRRAPGVSFQRDTLTGDGTNVVVRGLEPDMNAVKLNGLNLPVGNGTGRSADLSNLLADSVSKITISKSLLPSQDSAGTGGLVEIETLSPLNRPRRYANFLIEGGKSAKDFNKDFLVSGTVAGTFGNLGLSASVQYRDVSARTISYNNVLQYGRSLPLDANGRPTILTFEQVNPLTIFPFVEGAVDAYPTRLETNFNHVDQSTLAGTFSAEWRIGDHTNLKLDIQHSEANRTTYSLQDAFGAASKYTDRPGGAALAELNLSLAPGNAAISRDQSYAYDRDAKTITDTYSFNGKTTLGKVELTYLLGFAHGTETHPASFTTQLRMPNVDATAAMFAPEATDATGGYIITPWGPRHGSDIPLPYLSAAGWSFVNNPANFRIENASGQIDTTTGKNDRYTASYSAKYLADWGPVNYIEAGAYLERTEFRSNLVRSQLGGGVLASALPLEFGPSDLSQIGMTGAGFSVVSERSLRNFVGNIAQYAGGPTGFTLTPIVPNPDQDNQRTMEQTIAAYVQTRLDFGKLEVIGGVRYNHTELNARNLIFPSYIGPILPANGGGFGNDLVFQNAFSRLVTEKATAADFLPRVLFNYRESDNLIFRGGYFMSVARPQIGQLSTQTRISFINIPIPGPEGPKPILQINTGNPNLKPATTQNFDLSVEYYHKIGVMKLSGFYKRIDNLLQANVTNGPANLTAVTLPNHPYFQGAPYFDPAHPENAMITGTTPANSDHVATIWGIETQVERQFDFLPGAWNGLGIFANYTFTKSSRAERYSWAYGATGQSVFEFLSIPFSQQPKHSGTAALTYNKYGIDATLAYGFQSRAMSMFRPRGLSVYSEGVQTLDFRAEYYLRPSFGKIRVYVEASDLLKGTSTPDVQETFGGTGTTPKFYTRATYLGGRKFKLGVSTTF
ncbi:TonB-dependent receptor [Sphingomonas sp. CJ20]